MPFKRLSVVGDAAASDVNSGKSFSSLVAGVGAVGTLANNGVVTVTPSAVDQVLAGIYGSGSKVAGDSDLIAGNIKKDISIFGVTGTVEPVPTAIVGDNILNQSSTTRGAGGTAWTKVKSIKVLAPGSYRISFKGYRNASDGGARVYKNGVAIGILRYLTSSNVQYTEDFSGINVGDTLELWASGIGSGEFASVSEFCIKVGNTDLGYVVLD